VFVGRVAPMKAFRTTSASARANERESPHIVEMEVPEQGFAHSERKAMEEFHSSRKIRARFGRRLRRDGKEYCHWCFAEAGQADLFQARFGGIRLPLAADPKVDADSDNSSSAAFGTEGN
jgi:hypothetical protein